MATLPKASEITKFVKHVRANDLLLKARALADAPEGAGSWRYLIAAWIEVEPREVTAAMVATVKDADAKAREAAKAAKAKAAPAKAAPAKAAPVTPAAFAKTFAAWSDEDRAAFLAALEK
jgi:hypothetical protein